MGGENGGGAQPVAVGVISPRGVGLGWDTEFSVELVLSDDLQQNINLELSPVTRELSALPWRILHPY